MQTYVDICLKYMKTCKICINVQIHQSEDSPSREPAYVGALDPGSGAFPCLFAVFHQPGHKNLCFSAPRPLTLKSGITYMFLYHSI